MSGDVATDYGGSSATVPASFRFSQRPHRAREIHWHAWGPAAFEEATHLDKPIFLLISSFWCQWCHIMDETTFSEPSVIAILNRDYVPIRVDSDFRPDINQRYNQNGWPSVVLLSPEGEILWGGVYVPPKQMLYYLGHVRRYYSEHRDEIADQVGELRERRLTRQLSQTLPRSGLRSLLQHERTALVDLPAEAGLVLRDLYDQEYGGFTIHPHLKFPHPDALELLLLLARGPSASLPDALEMVGFSLEQMYEGGLWDKEEGGFFRYSAASDWSMPHTEKMLDENAALLRVVLLAAKQEQAGQRWCEIARRLIYYLNTTLWLPRECAFGGSQSADEEYYESGLTRASWQAPPVDQTIYTAWNARLISAYLLGAQVLNDPALTERALRTLDWLIEHMMHPQGSMYHYAQHRQPFLPGQLADQVWMTRTLLDAYECTERRVYLETAIALMHFACDELLDEACGLFYDYPSTSEAEGRLALREQPLIENALAAECLLRMASLSKRRNLRDTGLLVLAGCLDKYRRSGIQGAVYACVIAQAVENAWI